MPATIERMWMFIVIDIAIPALFIAFAAALFGSAYWAQKTTAPFYPSPAYIARRAFQAVKLQPGERFYDLGAGNGKVLLVAEREFGARATGFEISIAPYILTKFNLFFHRSRARVKLKNFYRADLTRADVVFAFLLPHSMRPLEEKLLRELKPGTRVISYAFPFPTWKPETAIPAPGWWQIFIYKR